MHDVILYNVTYINKNQVYLDSAEKSLLVKNSTEDKNLIRVGNNPMTPVTGSSNISLNGGFESDAASLDLITSPDASAHWSSRRVIHQSMSVDESNPSIELYVTSSSPATDGRHYRVLLSS